MTVPEPTTGQATPRVSADDLAFAADWMDAYDGEDMHGEPDDLAPAARRVAAWLRAEVARRENAIAGRAAVREVATRTGMTPARAREALRRIRQRTQEG